MKTLIEIGEGIQCHNLPEMAIRKITKDLTFKNPAYEEALRAGRMIPASMPKEFVLFDMEKNKCWMPRGYVYFLLKFLKKNGQKYKIQDNTLLLPELEEIEFHGKLKDYQEKATSQMLKYPIGVLESATGSGKTIMGISLIAQRKQPTLIIVHSTLLLNQWYDEIKRFLHYESGLIGDKTFIVKPITVGIINSVRKNLDFLKNKFGHIVVDETHKVSSDTYTEALQSFPAKYYLGLSATAYRSDGMSDAIFAGIGPKVHKVDKQMLYNTNQVLRPEVFKINTNFYYFFKNDYAAMIKELVNNKERNQLICYKIVQDLKLYNENIVIVSDRKEHCKTLQKMLLNEYNIESSVLVGGQSNKKEKKILVDSVKAGNCKVLLSTTKFLGEGFDSKDLVALFITTPIKFVGKLIQAAGRILRYKEGKTPRIYDFRDNQINVLKYMAYGRDRTYKNEWNR